MQNTEENSLSSSLNLHGETNNSLFQLLYLINDKNSLRHEIHATLTALNLGISLIIYLSMKQIGLFPTISQLSNQIVILALYSFLGLIVTQFAMGLLYGYQLFLKLQYLVFRNIIFPIALISTVNHQSQICSTTVVYVVAVLCTIIVFVLEWFIGKQYFARNLISQKGYPLSFYMMVFQILIAIYTFNSQQLKKCIVIVMVMFSAYVKFGVINTHLRRSKCLQYTLFKIQATLNIIYTAFLSYSQIVDILVQQKQSFIFIFPLVFFIVAAEFSAQYADIMKPLPKQFFTTLTHIDVFMERIQYVVDDLDKLGNSQNVDISTTNIIPIYYQHIKYCQKLDCGLSHQLQDFVMSSNANYKQLCANVFKIIQQLFQQFIVIQNQNLQIKFGFIKFYLRVGPNKLKILQLITQIEKENLDFQKLIRAYSMRRFVADIDVVQLIQSMKAQDSLHYFNQSMYALMKLLIEFWAQFLEQRVDFQKVLQTAQKITPIFGSIDMQIKQAISVQTYSTIQIMKVYSQYLRWIMNDQLKSATISDYAHLLNKKMSQLHEINCITADMQMGLIAISLQVKKLGQIKIANNQAANIFNYPKQQFLKMNVNNIMPSIFAKYHDDFLKVFLVNEQKKVNTDRRLIIGKKKEGYLFEIYLQLQKSVITNLQQFIFIANIQLAKSNEAHILIICDQKGTITDVNSTYKQIFQKSLKRNRNYDYKPFTNIQQLIPSFFEIAMNDCMQNKIATEFFDNPALGIMQIKFQITKISFTQCPEAGYAIKGYRIKQQKQQFFNKLSLTQILYQVAEERDLKGMKLQYLPNTNQYLFNQRLDIFGCGQLRSQYTIPYMKLECFGQILSQNYEVKPVKQYDNEIKTLRYFGDHFQRVEQPDSFESQMTEQLKTKINDIKFNLLKQKIQNQQTPLIERLPSICVLVFALIGVIILSFFYVTVSKQNSDTFYLVGQFIKSYNFRSKLAQYVINFQAQNDQNYGPFFKTNKQKLKQQLIDEITLVDLPQYQKQRALKIIYLQQSLRNSTFDDLVNDQTFKLPVLEQYSVKGNIFAAFKVIIGLFIVAKIVLSTIIMHWHRNKLMKILSLFLILPQGNIKKSHKKCVQFLKDSNQALNKMEENIAICEQTQQGDEQQNPHMKIRKFKNIALQKYIFNYLKLNIFTIFLLILFGVMVLNDFSRNIHFQCEVKLYEFISSVMPQYSIKMMRSYSRKKIDNNFQIPQKFLQKYQTLDHNLAQYDFQQTKESKKYFGDMLVNYCQKLTFNLPQNSSCYSIANGIMNDGISPSINFLSTRLAAIQIQPPSNQLSKQLNQLSVLLFHLVKPVIESLNQRQNNQIQEAIQLLRLQLTIDFILFLVLVVIDLIYVTNYPLNNISKNILHSKILIKLIPQMKKKSKNGYTEI